jgi:hypothetical protein
MRLVLFLCSLINFVTFYFDFLDLGCAFAILIIGHPGDALRDLFQFATFAMDGLSLDMPPAAAPLESVSISRYYL